MYVPAPEGFRSKDMHSGGELVRRRTKHRLFGLVVLDSRLRCRRHWRKKESSARRAESDCLPGGNAEVGELASQAKSVPGFVP